ncbi:MAG: GNAT family N-acetyltransferase [Candidatus Parabeggiatoa sp.]|nr:GNAT family N-acetyltransferase [Candidatus Parabeggiatoa sp.]
MPLDPNQITKRPIETSDMPFLQHLYGTIREQELTVVDWTDEQKAAFIAQQFQAQHHHYTTYYYDAAFELLLLDNQPIGRLYVHRRPSEICIMDIALLPAYCNQGLGSFLIKQIMAEATAHNQKVSLHVEPYNPALRLYQRLDFQYIEQNGAYDLMCWQPKSTQQENT